MIEPLFLDPLFEISLMAVIKNIVRCELQKKKLYFNLKSFAVLSGLSGRLKGFFSFKFNRFSHIVQNYVEFLNKFVGREAVLTTVSVLEDLLDEDVQASGGVAVARLFPVVAGTVGRTASAVVGGHLCVVAAGGGRGRSGCGARLFIPDQLVEEEVLDALESDRPEGGKPEQEFGEPGRLVLVVGAGVLFQGCVDLLPEGLDLGRRVLIQPFGIRVEKNDCTETSQLGFVLKSFNS